MSRTRSPADSFSTLAWSRVPTPVAIRFTLPVVRQLRQVGGLDLARPVTFLAGDNGTGKSTLIEALAVAAGFNTESGSQNFRFATRATESNLGDHLVLRWGSTKPRTGYFLRAESYYNVASEIERLDRIGPYPLLPAYGGRVSARTFPRRVLSGPGDAERSVPAGRAGSGTVATWFPGPACSDRRAG